MKDILKLISKGKELEANQIIKLLEDEMIRNYFITNYSCFKSDRNFHIYIDYINVNMKKNISMDHKMELIDLAINIDYYSVKFYDYIIDDLLKRKSYLLKLSILDFMNEFYYKEKVNVNYLNLNKLLSKRTSNNLVKFQTNINLFLAGDLNLKYFKKVSKTLNKEKTEPFYFYRYLNTINYYSQFLDFSNVIDIEEIISNSKFLSEVSKKDLKEIIDMGKKNTN
ncbi:hypothetical protein [uncultured Aquimarina sp.]|uniref:hypothetical protein n=1 Tax=uncultured Aquimarina sp. TaxID=575652 RepID=UPI002614458B|nr:hypothetical protein [uncultured Aquimarina sp.]